MASSKTKEIPPEVIDKLLDDLAPFSAVLGSDETATAPNPTPKVKIVSSEARIFAKPRVSRKKFETLPAETELPLIGNFGKFVGIEHKKQLYWIPKEHVQIAADLKPGSQESIRLDSPKSAVKGAASGILGGLKASLLRRACELRDEYRDNPYITIKGFTLELGLPPSLSIEFEFKE